jgi:hypothetical protein
MAALNENAITRLATVTGVDMKTAASTTLYTVPAGKTFYPTSVVVRNPSATLAGGTSYGFTGWRAGVDLSSMTTAVTDFMKINGADVTKYTCQVAGANFQITVTTGSTGAATATVDVFGFLA